MKKTLLLTLLLSVAASSFAQKQKVNVNRHGEITVGNQVIAYIEKVGCKMLSSDCQFFITDENDNLLIAVTTQSFRDKDRMMPNHPESGTVNYYVFAFKGFDTTAEIEIDGFPKEETIAETIARWRLIKGKRLDPEAVKLFVSSYGTRFSDKEIRQALSGFLLRK